MNLTFAKGGLPASVKNRAWQYCQMAWRGVTSKKALSRLAALSPLLLLGVGQMTHATDLLAGGKNDVKATFGADSFVMMTIIPVWQHTSDPLPGRVPPQNRTCGTDHVFAWNVDQRFATARSSGGLNFSTAF